MPKSTKRAAAPISKSKSVANKAPVQAPKADKPKAKDIKPPQTSSTSTLPKSVISALPSSAQIMKHYVAIASLFPAFVKELETAKKGGAIALARAFVAFHRMQERSDELTKPFDLLFQAYKSLEIPAAFEQAGVTNVPLDEGFRVGTSTRFFASIIPEERDKAYEWLRKNGLGDIIANTVNAQTLSAAAQTLRDEKNVELPTDFFKTADVPNTSVTKTK